MRVLLLAATAALMAGCAADAATFELRRTRPPRSASPSPRPSASFDARAYVGQGNRYSCKDFTEQWMAQRVLRLDATDPNRLDPDRDGLACESDHAPKDTFPVRR